MQHISILTANTDIHEPLINVFKSKVSVGESYCITRDNADEVMEKLSICSPFFSPYFLVEVVCSDFDLDSFRKLLIRLRKLNDCKFIFKHTRRDTFDFTEKNLDNVYVMNNYIPEQKLLSLYLKTYSTKYITAEAEDLLYKKMKGQWNLLSTVMLEIEEITHHNISKNDIDKLISPSINLNINRFVTGLITGNGLERQVKILFNYKYANKYVYRKMCEVADTLIDLKKDYIKGLLRYNNIHEYSKEKEISHYLVNNYLEEILTKYSLEYLYYFKFVLRKYKKDSDSVLQILLEMVK